MDQFYPVCLYLSAHQQLYRPVLSLVPIFGCPPAALWTSFFLGSYIWLPSSSFSGWICPFLLYLAAHQKSWGSVFIKQLFAFMLTSYTKAEVTQVYVYFFRLNWQRLCQSYKKCLWMSVHLKLLINFGCLVIYHKRIFLICFNCWLFSITISINSPNPR